MVNDPRGVNTMSRATLRVLLTAFVFVTGHSLATDAAQAGCGNGCCVCGGCSVPVCAPAGHWETDTIMVPQCSFKTVQKPVICYRPQMKSKTITVNRLVPDTRQVPRMETVMEPVQRTRTVSHVVCTPSWQNVNRNIVTMVPQTVTKQGFDVVCKPVMVQTTRTVCRDAGGYATKCYTDACGCPQSCQVWVPNIVQEQVPVTVCKPQLYKVPITYNVTVCKPQVQSVTERVCKPVFSTQTEQVPYTDFVPKQVQRMVTETFCRAIPEQQVVQYCTMVAYTEQVDVRVPVTTMVPQQVRRWVCDPAPVMQGSPIQSPQVQVPAMGGSPVQVPGK